LTRWDRNFFSTTRGQIVLLLRRQPRTVDDLAGVLDLTDNAVRAHLTRLERDGLVEQRGVRRGERRPSLVYQLASEAEALFLKAYAPTLGELLEVLEHRSGSQDLLEIMHEVGRRLAPEQRPGSRDERMRLQAAADVLSGLGGLAEVETDADGKPVLRGYGCPLSDLIKEHPELCRMAEALVAEVSGLRVAEHCERDVDGMPPRCAFAVAP
jgi:predicted ArsR family transcriptional regulator